MRPLRIRCWPQSLFWYEPFIMLDTLVQRAVMMERYGSDYYALPTINPATPLSQIVYPTIPLERRELSGQWWYACSWVKLADVTVSSYSANWVRGFAPTEAMTYADHKGRGNFLIKTWQGPDKLYNVQFPALVTSELTWYAVGDEDEVRRLLATYYHAIGKKTAYGYGGLTPYQDGSLWQVDEWHSDWSEHGPDGQLMRGIVPDMSEFFPLDLRRHAIRPPYHVQANYVLCQMPS